MDELLGVHPGRIFDVTGQKNFQTMYISGLGNLGFYNTQGLLP